MENFSFLTPGWYLIIAFLFALATTVIVYYKTKENISFNTWQKLTLAALRFLGMFCIGSLLLAPFLKYQQTKVEKPILIIGQDVSQSIGLALNEQEQKTYRSQWTPVINDLEDKFKVITYSFGDGVKEGLSENYQDQVSNLSDFLETVQSSYGDQNLGGVILATDGIYNEGKNPLYITQPVQAPIFAVALGDTTLKKDAYLQRVFHNDLAYLNDQFTIQVDINAQECTGGTSLTVYKVENNQNNKIATQNIIYTQREFFTSVQFTITANRTGVQRYRVALSPLQGESNTQNNYRDFFVDVLDNREKILIYAAAPHPDVSAIRQSLEKLSKYELTTKYWGEATGTLSDFDVIILYQLPAAGKNIKEITATLAQNKTPLWFILGSMSDINLINSLQAGISLNSKINNVNEVEPEVESSFSLFILSDELKNSLKTFPPLSSPFGEYQSLTGNQVLLNQSISKIETNYPLLSFHESNEIKTAVLAGEGIFKWRLFDYLNHQNHEIFDELIQKSLQFLTVKDDKRRFRVVLNDRIFKENEEVQLDAELYNESYELINDPETTLSLYNENKEEFTYTFDRREKHYHLNLNLLKAGHYSFKAQTKYGGETFNNEGVFSVEPLQLEAQNTTARHNILHQLAELKNGQVIYPDEINSLPDLLANREDLKPIQYAQITTEPLLNFKWLFLPIFLFLATEWFLRRFFGTY